MGDGAVVPCANCGAKNRVPADAAGTLSCVGTSLTCVCQDIVDSFIVVLVGGLLVSCRWVGNGGWGRW